MALISLSQFVEMHGKDKSNAVRLIREGRLPAVRIGRQWCIEESTPWPSDNRVKNGHYKGWREKYGTQNKSE